MPDVPCIRNLERVRARVTRVLRAKRKRTSAMGEGKREGEKKNGLGNATSELGSERFSCLSDVYARSDNLHEKWESPYQRVRSKLNRILKMRNRNKMYYSVSKLILTLLFVECQKISFAHSSASHTHFDLPIYIFSLV